jgi:hypothetical protein
LEILCIKYTLFDSFVLILEQNRLYRERKCMSTATLSYLSTIHFTHHGDCGLLGVTPDMTIYVEEIYDDESWIAQSAIHIDGSNRRTVDEDYGANTSVEPLPLPPDIIRPHSGFETMKALNFGGARHRGLRSEDRIQDTARDLDIHTKMTLIDTLKLPVAPPMILGLAESYVISEALIIRPNLFVVCRRLRIAYALAESKTDSDNQRYDYDTLVIQVAHLYDREQDADVSMEDALNGLPGVDLHRPTDCLICNDHLFISDGGTAEGKSAVHIWKIAL